MSDKQPLFRREQIYTVGGHTVTLWLYEHGVSTWLPLRGAPALLAVLAPASRALICRGFSRIGVMARNESGPRREELARLAELVERSGTAPPAAAERFSCGCAALDGLLPGGGLGRGSLVEWLADGSGGGAGLSG